MAEQTMEQDSKPALYFRVRMVYNKWYVFQYDEDISKLDDAYGPYSSHGEAYEKADTLGLTDMDKSNVPSQKRTD